MAVVFTRKFEHGELNLFSITESLDQLSESLTSQELQTLDSFKSNARALEFAATRTMLHKIYPEQELEYDSCGAPSFRGSDNLSVSISHTEFYTCVVVSQNSSCAVDIELFSRNVSRVQSRYISPKEAELKTDENFEILAWCAKETAYKYLRQQQVDLLKDLTLVAYDSDAKIIKIKAFESDILTMNFEFFNDLALVHII